MGTKWPTCRVNLYFGDSEIWANLEVKHAKIYGLQPIQPIKQMLHKISCTHLLSVKSTLFKGTSHLLTFRFKEKFSIFSHFIPKNQLKSDQLIWNLPILPHFFHGSPPTFTLNLHPNPPSTRGATTPAAARQCRRRRWRRRSAPQQGRQGQRRPAARSPGAAALFLCFFDKVSFFSLSAAPWVIYVWGDLSIGDLC